jgi:hypothetical protein
MDNAPNNNTFLECLYSFLNEEQPEPDNLLVPTSARIRCFPHIVNIITQRILKAFENPADDDDTPDLAEVNKDGYDDDDSDAEGEEVEDSGDKDDGNDDEGQPRAVGGVITKIRQLVRTIRASGQRQELLNRVVEMGNQAKWWTDHEQNVIKLKLLRLILDVCTRWDSTYQMLVRAFEFRQVDFV